MINPLFAIALFAAGLPTERPPPDPETPEERAARLAYVAKFRAENEARWKREEAERAEQAALAKRRQQDERAADIAALRVCLRCADTGPTRRHKNGRPAVSHRCPECRERRKRADRLENAP